MEVCEYCKKASQILQLCPHCEKVWYCNESHATNDLKTHSPNCFPAVIQSEDGRGRFWVAARDISKGELIFSEAALVVGPNSETASPSPLYPTCLGCCRITNTSHPCSKCRWPLCSKQCEKINQHAHFECNVFRKHKIQPSSRPEYYLYVQFLRALLLENVNPSAFKNMIKLESHAEGRKGHPEEWNLTLSFYKFLTEECNLCYDFQHVDRVVGICRINSYSADIMNSKLRRRRFCTALFCQTSLINHDCLPNTRTIIYDNPDSTLCFGLFASVDILKGQQISQQYFPIVKGTMARRNALKEWFFECNCKRCSDPTEFDTFFSCLKCPECTIGFMCSSNSLDETSLWKCNNSPGCTHSETTSTIQAITAQAETEVANNENDVRALESVLEDLISKKRVHIYHHIAINIQYEILHKIVKALNNDRDVDLLRRGSKYCRNILKVVDVISPGFSYYRGVILYFLSNCLFALYEMKELERSDCCMDELKEIIQEGIEIMEVEPNDTVYRDMADELETYKRALSYK